ncbi:MAG: glutamate racemase, partial [Patescibacteria group bacterium]
MIGIFDSGIGGFTVVKEIMRRMPDYQLLYFGDTARTPYGNKGAETIKQYAVEDAEFLLSKGAKIIVIACNTVSAVAYDYLCAKFPGVPIFEVITPAAEAAARATKNGRVGVIGTRATIGSGIYDKKIKQLFSPSDSQSDPPAGGEDAKARRGQSDSLRPPLAPPSKGGEKILLGP